MKPSAMMNEYKLNETYSSLEKSYLILSKELSAMKEMNEQLKQRLKELETNNITKEEMKEIIKEGLTPIINVLVGKERETVNVETQTDEIEEEKKEEIKRIQQVIESEELDTGEYGFVRSLTVTEDKRIASGGADGDISVSSYDLEKKKWKREIHKEKAHICFVYSLCPLNGNRLLSGGGYYDNSIKVWSLSDVELTLIKEIKAINEYTDDVLKVIPLSKERFASCS